MKLNTTSRETLEVAYLNSLKMISNLQAENYELRKELAETISELKELQEGQEQDLPPYPEPINLGCDFIKVKNFNEGLLKGGTNGQKR